MVAGGAIGGVGGLVLGVGEGLTTPGGPIGVQSRPSAAIHWFIIYIARQQSPMILSVRVFNCW